MALLLALDLCRVRHVAAIVLSIPFIKMYLEGSIALYHYRDVGILLLD